MKTPIFSRAWMRRVAFGAGGMIRADLLLDRAREGDAAVLMYHYFAPAGGSADPLVIPVDRFREQMLDVARRHRPIPMSEAVAAARAGRALPRGAVVITVDDVGPDFLAFAWPILESLSMPVCLAIVTGFADPDARNERLFGIAHAFVGNDPAAAARLGRSLGLTSLSYGECFDRLAGLGPDRLAEMLERSGIPVEIEGPVPGSVRLPLLGIRELKRIAGSGLVEFASHSVTHPDLEWVPEPWLRWELEASRRALVETFGACAGFVYPGGRVPVGEAANEAIRRAGYDYACVVLPGFLGRRSDLTAIRRIAVDGTEPMSAFRLRVAGAAALFH